MQDATDSLWAWLGSDGLRPASRLLGWVTAPDAAVPASVALADLAGASFFGGQLEALRGRTVIIAAHDQLTAALALVELDGVAARMVLCTPDLTAATLQAVAATAEADALVIDQGTDPAKLTDAPHLQVRVGLDRRVPNGSRRADHSTDWVLLTSGTTGVPKLVLHSLASLAGALPRGRSGDVPVVWSTFYDIRRYGGLQMFLRAMLGGTDMVLSSAGEPVPAFLARAARAGVTHLSGTPSHWRGALMSGAIGTIDPQYVRLSGEIADQTVLDGLKAAFPRARVGHAFASTEAGVAFDVNDGFEGFPASLIGQSQGQVDMKVEDGTLRIRSRRTSPRYLGSSAASIADADGYVDTGDIVELREGRYRFAGRRGGVINVGGQKVFPEEVEAVLNADPRVRMARVLGRRSPITGAIVVAEVVLAEPADGQARDAAAGDAIRRELLDACRRTLAAHKVPASLKLVPTLGLSAAGKLSRA